MMHVLKSGESAYPGYRPDSEVNTSSYGDESGNRTDGVAQNDNMDQSTDEITGDAEDQNLGGDDNMDHHGNMDISSGHVGGGFTSANVATTPPAFVDHPMGEGFGHTSGYPMGRGQGFVAGYQTEQGRGFVAGYQTGQGLSFDLPVLSNFTSFVNNISFGGEVPQDSEREFRDTVRDFNHVETARRFERDQGMPSGPGQSSRTCSLPELPRIMNFTAAWEDLHYDLRPSPTPERFTFPGIPSGENVVVSIDELRSLYDTATDYWAFLSHCVPQPWEYDRSFRDVMRLARNAAAREVSDRSTPSRSSMGLVNEVVGINRPAPRRRGPPSRRSPLGSENVDRSSRRGS